MRKNSNAKPEEKEKLNPNGLTQSRSSQQFNVVRRVYQQDALNKDADYQAPDKPWSYMCRSVVKSCGFGECIVNALPITKWLPRYSPKRYLLSDLVAGATTAVMHIPQGMAYALLAEVPPIVGLYMAFFPVLVYVIFGTSPHVSMGTFAVACLMAGKVVTQHATINMDLTLNNSLAESDTIIATSNSVDYTPLQVLSIVTISVGIFQMLMWTLRLGAVSTLLSEPLVSGFTTAASFHVLASQLKDLLGVKLPKTSGNYKIIKTIIDICKNMTNTNLAAILISFIACLVIALNNELLKPWVSKRSRVPVPIELIAIVVGTLVSQLAGLNALYGISLVGNIPTGLPIPQVPPVELFPDIAVDAFTITMVTYTITMSMALIFAAKEKYEIDANQELLALGASNVFGSFFTCAPLCASLSRSYIQYQAGAKTGVTSLVSALLILCVLLWIGPFFEDLPRCVLASIIVVSLKGMFMQVTDLPKFWKLSKLDAVVWLVTFIMTAFVNIDIGLAAGLVASVGALFCRSQKPYTCLLGRVLNTDLYLDTKRYRAAEELPGIKIFHYCGGLNFATKNLFRETLFRKIGYQRTAVVQETDEDNNLAKSESSEWQPSRNSVKCVIIDATALSYVDAPGIKSLVAVQKELVASNITVLLAGANGPVLEMIDKYNSLESDRLQLDTFPTVHDAVVYYKVLESKRQRTTSVNIA
ncbi:prestin isoform X2 [Plodia interpunctella]|uniref:prestin isoform X2 n=1 Tax=Plodia interpunctella TaxID=58824 RepID=UPI002368D9E0|nr:prestin isoform X2 [Plodia interpunctella]XP_053616851.1 prestin isoform X2 [Plodia interpunctella]XP_053616852.1 prestin isoform X2 [Plodia interpunctella]XP_053616853.1 prestin isoform X2 [Plodia interpunctella]XP_053616854.1 prestin isoform X2 [Plodia interpunctella]XP_053616856.1 prestin isoform X2 [Plodia interpunctella]